MGYPLLTLINFHLLFYIIFVPNVPYIPCLLFTLHDMFVLLYYSPHSIDVDSFYYSCVYKYSFKNPNDLQNIGPTYKFHFYSEHLYEHIAYNHIFAIFAAMCAISISLRF